MVDETPSAVVEVVVLRAETCNWDSYAMDVITALSKSCACVRNGVAVIAKWRMKCYEEKRKVCSPMDCNAHHVHGFFRLRDDCLDEVLSILRVRWGLA